MSRTTRSRSHGRISSCRFAGVDDTGCTANPESLTDGLQTSERAFDQRKQTAIGSTDWLGTVAPAQR